MHTLSLRFGASLTALVAVASLSIACGSTTVTTNSTGPGGTGTGADGGGSGTGNGGGNGTPVTFDSACAREAAAICAIEKQCAVSSFHILYGADDAACVSANTASCLHYTQVKDAGFSADDVNTCAAAYEVATCPQYEASTICKQIPGKRPLGSTCQYPGQCAEGTCVFGASGGCGTCAAYATEGGACSATKPCNYFDGLYCAASMTCVRYSTAGAQCGTSTMQPFCAPGLVCSNNQCSTGQEMGQACSPGKTACDATQPIVCDATADQCVAITFGDAGATCGASAATAYCNAGYCDPTAKKCLANLDQGASCMPGKLPSCKQPYTCTSAGKCDFSDDLGCN